jgi:predicted secreted protein
MKTVILLIFAPCIFIFAGCVNPRTAPVNDPNTTSSTIKVKLGEDFTIKLPSNLTNGYSWRMGELKRGVVQMRPKEYKRDEMTNKIIVIGREEIWTLKAVGTGRALIKFDYIHQGDIDVPPAKTALFTVIVSR